MTSLRDATGYGYPPLQAQVREFHEAFGQPVLHEPLIPPSNRIALRHRLMTEELREWVDAVNSGQGIANTLSQDVNMVEVADALGDLLYVVMGTALEFGLNMGPILAEIHRSNMAKLGPDGKPVYDEHGKVTKPPGWTPPDIEGVLRRQGWRR